MPINNTVHSNKTRLFGVYTAWSRSYWSSLNDPLLANIWEKAKINKCRKFEFKSYLSYYYCAYVKELLPPLSPKHAVPLFFLAQSIALTMEVSPYSSLLVFHLCWQSSLDKTLSPCNLLSLFAEKKTSTYFVMGNIFGDFFSHKLILVATWISRKTKLIS